MKNRLLKLVIVLCFLSTGKLFAQANDTEVEVKGIGMRRDDALQDAMRNAVGQAMGVALSSETKVENFVVIQDAIQTRVNGYISSYKVIKESPFPDRFEISIKALVSLNPLKADLKILSQSLGGDRFLVMYDDRNIPENELSNYEAAAERINNFLSEKRYRYIDRNRFNQLKKEALQMFHESEPGQETYVQKFGILADAQFIIFISKVTMSSRSEAFDTRTASKAVIEVKAYDNCTAEGLGTIILESDWKSNAGVQAAISEAINKNFNKLITTFTAYIGEWVNNGTPYELRFYSSGTYRDMRDLRQKLKDDTNFGGQLEIVSLNNYSKLNCTFRKKPDELADKVLDYADEIPAFREKRMDVKFIFGRQISFAPHNTTIPELQGMPQQQPVKEESVSPSTPVKADPVKSEKKPAASTPAKKTPAKKTSAPAKKN